MSASARSLKEGERIGRDGEARPLDAGPTHDTMQEVLVQRDHGSKALGGGLKRSLRGQGRVPSTMRSGSWMLS